MRYVILRDDDTNALTPADCLERLYRPFLDCGLPVNLATIPAVRTDAHRPDGQREGYLCFEHNGGVACRELMRADSELAGYLRANAGFHVVQHGFDHSLFEFADCDERELEQRIDHGARVLAGAGFPRSSAFVAPYDKFSRPGLRAVARHFRVVSGGWFELRRLPVAWWPAYLRRKISRHAHWQAGRTLLLSHPGCLLSRFRPRTGMLERIKQTIAAQPLTVLVTHWWEYFPNERADEDFIQILHRTAEHLASDPGIRVITFEELAAGRVPLN